MSNKGGFSLSNVDLLACGLGACIILMLIFIINISGDGQTSVRKKGKEDYVAKSSLITPEIQEGKMVFVRQIEIDCSLYQDYLYFQNNPHIGKWFYDENLRNYKGIEEQVYYLPAKKTVVYSFKSDTLIQKNIRFELDNALLTQDLEFARKGAEITAKIIEGSATSAMGNTVFSGFHEETMPYLGQYRDVSITFKRKAVTGKEQLKQLIQFSE